MAGEEKSGAVALDDSTIPPTGTLGTKLVPGINHLFPYDTRTTWGPWAALAAVVVITALGVGLALAGSLAIAPAAGSGGSGAVDARQLLAMLAAQAVMIGGTLVAARWSGTGMGPTLALKAPAGGLRTYASCLVLMLSIVAAYTAATYFLLQHDLTDDLSQMLGLFRGPTWPLALLVIGIGAPLSEELLFRGFLQSALVPTPLGYWGATLVTTTIWTSLHAGYSIAGLVEVFLIGLVFATFLRKTGSLRVPLVCHAIYNSLIGLILILAPSSWLGL